MAKKAESRLQLKIRKALQLAWPKSKWVKLHGGPFQAAGLPDLLGCVGGLFYGFEIKVPGKGKPSRIQVETLEAYRKAGAVACIIESVEEALAMVEATQAASKGRRSKKRIRKWVRAFVRATNRENLDHRGKSRAGRRSKRVAGRTKDQSKKHLGQILRGEDAALQGNA